MGKPKEITMNNQYKNILIIILVPIITFTLWIVFFWPPDKNIMLFFLIGALAGWSVFGAGLSLSHIAQRNDQKGRITLFNKQNDDQTLTTIDGIGIRIFDIPGNPHLKYMFFCILYLPICPIDCYSVQAEGKKYRCYGYAKWNILEIIGIYMKWWGGLMGIMFTLYSITGFLYKE